MLSTLTTTVVNVHLLAYLVEEGYDRGFAAAIAGAHGLFSVSGRIIISVSSRFIPDRWVPGIICELQALALPILLRWPGTGGVVLFIILFGTTSGAMTLSRATLVADYFGRSSYDVISGVISLFTTFSRAAAPLGAGVGYSIANDYTPVFWGIAIVALFATGAIIMAGQSR